MHDYLPILIQIAVGIAVPIAALVASHLFGQRARTNAAKDSAYECGNAPVANDRPHPRFGVKFYVTAMLFILFDIEVVFLLPLALVWRDLIAEHIAVFAPAAVFFGILTLGLLYEIRTGALDWFKQTPDIRRRL
jgi:NADH-quinone oxidoreductase subunit A